MRIKLESLMEKGLNLNSSLFFNLVKCRNLGKTYLSYRPILSYFATSWLRTGNEASELEMTPEAYV